MSKTQYQRVKATDRPTLDGTQKYIMSRQKANSATKQYFDQVNSRGMRDPFANAYKTDIGFDLIKPPLNPYSLSKMVFENSFLVQCIDALVQNIHGFGYRLEFIGKDILETDKEAVTEQQWMEELFDRPNPLQSFQEFRVRLGWDYFVFGNCFMEVTRDAEGRVLTMHHLPAPTVRISKIEPVDVPVTDMLARYGKMLKVKTSRQFRRYCQINDMGKQVYFKEFGDPRVIDPKTGKENPALTMDTCATEVIHLSNYNAQSIYGIPIWYSQLPSILGSRQAELTNLDFFENNAIPAMAILVAGGYLTGESYEFLANNFEEVKGRGSTNKVLILEARGTVEDASNTGAVPSPSITMQGLNKERQNDALWQEYEKQCRDKIRACFRLAPVLVGSATDYTFASARVSLEVAENQIFIPERVKFDDIMNTKILPSWSPKYWRFRSAPAAIATSEDLIQSVEAFSTAGAITPNVAIGILNEKLNLDIPKVQEFWGDLPLDLVHAVLRSQGGEDKSNFVINAFKTLSADSIANLKTIPVLTPGNADSPAETKPAPASPFEPTGTPKNGN
jgi:PBSX family phage portal protein